MSSTICNAAFVISMVSEVGTGNVCVNPFLYCCKSSRKRLLIINTVTALATQFCPRSLLALLAAKVATAALSESNSVTYSPKLLLVHIDCLFATSDVSIHEIPFNSFHVCTIGRLNLLLIHVSFLSANSNGVCTP